MAPLTGRWRVAHVLASSTCDRAACAHGVATVRHSSRVMAHDLVHTAGDWAWSSRAPIVALAVAHVLPSSTCDRAACAHGVVTVRHSSRVMAHDLVHTAGDWAWSSRAPIVALAVAHVLSSSTCDRAPCANGVATVRHGVRIMANDLVHPTSNGASGRRAPAVAVATFTRRWGVTHMLASKTCDWAACANGVATFRHGVRIMAQDLVHAAGYWAWAH